LVDEHWETVRRTWEERFEKEHGPWRGHWEKTIGAFLECGDLECGFARVRCPRCGWEFHLPFSCKRRICPPCEARRRVEWADHVVSDVLPDLGYRQLVFTVPRILRRIFMRERALRGELMRTAYAVTREFLAAQFPLVKDAVPYFVITVHTYGSVGNVHPHAHALCSEGVLDRDGVFHRLPGDFDWGPLAELFRHAVLAMLVERERLAPQTREMLLGWRHSGFGADASTGAVQGDREGLYRLACYLHKAPFALERMEYTRRSSEVVYHGKNQAVAGRGTVVYDPAAFLALVLVHVPEPREMRARYYGAASSTIRRGGRKGRLSEGVDTPPAVQGEEEGSYVKARRRTWARLIARVYGADALKCRRCGGAMRIISFITDPEVVEQILRHVGLWGKGRSRGPPDGAAAGEAGERYVVVEEYAQESPPDDDWGDARRDWWG
jgi:hypothetical protein